MAQGKTSAFTKLPKKQDPVLDGPLATPATQSKAPKADVGDTVGEGIEYAKKAKSAFDKISPPTQKFERTEQPYQDQRKGEREATAAPAEVPVTSQLGAAPGEPGFNEFMNEGTLGLSDFDLPTPGLGGSFGSSGADLIGPGLGGAAGLLSLVQGARSNNPAQIAGGAAGLYGSAGAAGLVPSIGSMIGPGLESLTGAAAGTGGAAAGILGLSALPALYMIPGISDLLSTGGDRAPSVAHEIRTQAKNAPVAEQQLQTGANGLTALPGASGTTLQEIIDNSLQAQAAMQQMSAPIDLGGRKAAGIRYPDYSWLRNMASTLLPQSNMAEVKALDKSYSAGGNIRSDRARAEATNQTQWGADEMGNQTQLPNNNPLKNPADVPFDWGAPTFDQLVRDNARYANFTPSDTPYTATPGTYETSLRDLFSANNPNFASTPWGTLSAPAPTAGGASAGNNLLGTLGFAGIGGPRTELRDADNPNRI